MGTRVEDSEDRRNFRGIMERSSIGQANAERSRQGYMCVGPLGFHKPSPDDDGKVKARCLSCNKKIQYISSTASWKETRNSSREHK